ncbi:MAG TPA: hypothetical protein VMH48_07580 [Methylomirabilota bacterium]|nr:hypothetical protein [Methylomirabilota bacterium]
MIGQTAWLTAAPALLAFSLFSSSAHAQAKQEASSAASALPDVAGIRPGMSAQEAYNLLKARNPNIQIGMGQIPIAGFGEKPVVTEMRALVSDPSAPEILTVWLTTPPNKQVVMAVGRVLDYDPSQPLLRSNVLESLRQKYGRETENNMYLVSWVFDEHGQRFDPSRLKQLNCTSAFMPNLNVASPQGATFPAPTALIYTPQPANPCDFQIDVTAQLTGSSGQDQTYVRHILLMVWDRGLQRQTQDAYQAYLANADARKGKEELEKAKQRTVPKF